MAFGICKQHVLSSQDGLRYVRLSSLRKPEPVGVRSDLNTHNARLNPPTVQGRQQHLRAVVKMQETQPLALNGSSAAHERDQLDETQRELQT